MPQDISIPSDPLVWLLWFVLAGVGAFLLKVGLSLVESIKSNTVAVVSLTGKIEKLCEQQAAANALVHSQMGAHMNTIQREFDGLKREIRDVRGLRRGEDDGPTTSDGGR